MIRKALQGCSLPGSEDGAILPLTDILTTLHGKRILHLDKGGENFTLSSTGQPSSVTFLPNNWNKNATLILPPSIFLLSFIHLIFGSVCAIFLPMEKTKNT